MFILQFNSDLEIVQEIPVTFDYPVSVVFANKLLDYSTGDENSADVKGAAFIFAPYGGAGMKKLQNPNNKDFAYLELEKNKVTGKIEVKHQTKFTSPATFWYLDQMILGDDNGYYFYGGSIDNDKKYFNELQLANPVPEASKYTSTQLMKVVDGKIVYCTNTPIDEYASKAVTPPSQKKPIIYKGKKFRQVSKTVTSKGEFFVTGQSLGKGKVDGAIATVNKDILGFYYDTKGVLKAAYSFNTKEGNEYSRKFGVEMELIEDPQTGKFFWGVYEVKTYRVINGLAYPLRYPRIASIDKDGKLSDFKRIGGEKSPYYLDNGYPYLETEKGHRVVFFGSDKPGKNLWFAQVKLR